MDLRSIYSSLSMFDVVGLLYLLTLDRPPERFRLRIRYLNDVLPPVPLRVSRSESIRYRYFRAVTKVSRHSSCSLLLSGLVERDSNIIIYRRIFTINCTLGAKKEN